MTIIQLTRATQDKLTLWQAKAVHDETVRPWLSVSAHMQFDTVPDTDWTCAYFMDDQERGLLSASFDHQRHGLGIGLWVLGGDKRAAFKLMRFAINVLPKRYGLNHIHFRVSAANTVWREQVQRSVGAWLWGVEPRAAFDPRTGEYTDMLHFNVPVDQIRAPA